MYIEMNKTKRKLRVDTYAGGTNDAFAQVVFGDDTSADVDDTNITNARDALTMMTVILSAMSSVEV